MACGCLSWLLTSANLWVILVLPLFLTLLVDINPASLVRWQRLHCEYITPGAREDGDDVKL